MSKLKDINQQTETKKSTKLLKSSFHSYKQLDAMDCGPTCLRMIAKHYGRNYSLQFLRERSFITNAGVSMQGISDAAESIGFRTMGVKISYQQLVNVIRNFASPDFRKRKSPVVK